jgi:hypothetical protein
VGQPFGFVASLWNYQQRRRQKTIVCATGASLEFV